MPLNKPIVVSALIIGGSATVQAIAAGKPITRILIGSYIFVLVLAVLDLFGGTISQLASALALIAAISVVLTQFPWDKILSLVKSPGAASGGGGSGGGF